MTMAFYTREPLDGSVREACVAGARVTRREAIHN